MSVLHSRWGELYRGTLAELALEPAVAALGVPYRTNFPCFLFRGGHAIYPDFVLPTLGLVIEVDGPEHSQPARKRADAARSALLRSSFGWRVVRCTNKEALADPRGTVIRLMAKAGLPNRPGAIAPRAEFPPGEARRRRGRRRTRRGTPVAGAPRASGARTTRKPKPPKRQSRHEPGKPSSPRSTPQSIQENS